MTKVSLVIAAYNQLPYTRQCVESIERLTDVPYELIVVNNGSGNKTTEFLSRLKATVITNATNLGCAKAWNQGIRVCTGSTIGILNNDIVVTPGWLSGLLSFKERTGHGIVSPAAREGLLNYDLDAYAAEFTRRCSGATRRFDIYAACMIIRREVFERIGLFDEGFSFGGCEDVDLIWRAKEAGFSIGMTGSVLIHHFGMITQDAIKQTETRAYPASNLAHFKSKWGRTVRGTWPKRRWVGLRDTCASYYERLRYGHTLVEKGPLHS